MSGEPSAKLRTGFCIYIDTICHGVVPVSDGDDNYIVFKTDFDRRLPDDDGDD